MRVRLIVTAFRVWQKDKRHDSFQHVFCLFGGAVEALRARSDCRPSPRSDTFPAFMRVGVPKETAEGEHRVALVPEVVAKLKTKGIDVLVESGAGADALLPDGAFLDAGAQLTADTG